MKKKIIVVITYFIGLLAFLNIGNIILNNSISKESILFIISAFCPSAFVFLTSSIIVKKKELRTFSYFGFLLATLGTMSSFLPLIHVDFIDKLTIITISIINFSIALTSLLLQIKLKHKLLEIASTVTIINISIATFILLHIINGNFKPRETYLMIFVLFCFFVLIGGIFVSLLNYKMKKVAPRV